MLKRRELPGFARVDKQHDRGPFISRRESLYISEVVLRENNKGELEAYYRSVGFCASFHRVQVHEEGHCALVQIHLGAHCD